MNAPRTDTPRTDAFLAGMPGTWREWQDKDFQHLEFLCKQLERDNALFREALKKVVQLSSDDGITTGKPLLMAIEAAKAAVSKAKT